MPWVFIELQNFRYSYPKTRGVMGITLINAHLHVEMNSYILLEYARRSVDNISTVNYSLGVKGEPCLLLEQVRVLKIQ